MTQTMKAWFAVPGPEGAVFELRETPGAGSPAPARSSWPSARPAPIAAS